MLTKDAIQWAGSQQALAKILGRTRQSVWRWGEFVPEEFAYKIHFRSQGEVPIHEEHYEVPEVVNG